MTTLTIDSRFKGPPDSGNGGYVGGPVATTVQGDLRVRLMAPPPLDTPLELDPQGDGEWVLSGTTGPVARAVATQLALDVPSPPQ